MIDAIRNIEYNPIVTPQSTKIYIYSFDPKDADKVHMSHNENIIVGMKIANCILRGVLVDPKTDASLLYIKAFDKMGLLQSVLSPPTLALKSSSDYLSLTLDTIRLIINIGNEYDGYIISK